MASVLVWLWGQKKKKKIQIRLCDEMMHPVRFFLLFLFGVVCVYVCEEGRPLSLSLSLILLCFKVFQI